MIGDQSPRPAGLLTGGDSSERSRVRVATGGDGSLIKRHVNELDRGRDFRGLTPAASEQLVTFLARQVENGTYRSERELPREGCEYYTPCLCVARHLFEIALAPSQ